MRHIPRIDISNIDPLRLATEVQRYVYLTLLLAVKDRATEVRMEPSLSEEIWKLRIEIDGIWEDMEPLPLHIPVSQEVRRLARMRSGFRWWRRLTGRSDQPTANEGSIRLTISGTEIDVSVSVHSSGYQAPEFVVLRLPSTTHPSEEAWRILREFLEWGRRRQQTSETTDST